MQLRQLQDTMLAEAESNLKFSLATDARFSQVTQSIGKKPTDLAQSKDTQQVCHSIAALSENIN